MLRQSTDKRDEAQAWMPPPPRENVEALFVGKDVHAFLSVRPSASAAAGGDSGGRQAKAALSRVRTLFATCELLCLCEKRSNGHVSIFRVSHFRHGPMSVQKRWRLDELKEFKAQGEACLSLAFEGDKPLEWETQRPADRNSFLLALHRLCSGHLQSMPATNVDPKPSDDAAAAEAAPEAAKKGGVEEFMSLDEERQLRELIGDESLTGGQGVVDFDTAYSRLAARLYMLESSNVQDLLMASPTISGLLVKVEGVDQQLQGMNTWLSQYERQLTNMRRYIEHIENRNNRMEVITTNQKGLLTAVTDIINQISLDEATRTALEAPNLSDPSELDNVVRAAYRLKTVLSSAESPELSTMECVAEQTAVARKILVDFCRRFVSFMDLVFQKLETILKARRSQSNSGSGGLPKTSDHSEAHRLIAPYAKLLQWLGEINPAPYDTLVAGYTSAMLRSFKRELRSFFSDLHAATTKESRQRRERLTAVTFTSSAKRPDLDWLKAARAAEQTGLTPEKAFAHGLHTVMKVVMGESKFLQEAFDLPTSVPDPDKEPSSKRTLALKTLFPMLQDELTELVDTAYKADPFYLLAVLIELERYMENPDQFVQELAHGLQRTARRLFSDFIDKQMEDVAATQIQIKRSGVTSHFIRFPHFVDYMEECGTQKLADLPMEEMEKACNSLGTVVEYAYHKVITAMFAWLTGVPDQFSTPKFTYILRLENYHYFVKTISKKRVACLKQYVDQAQAEYDKHLKLYCELATSSRFARLVEFFAGIDVLLESLPPEEIQFQSAHSKQACSRAVLKFDSLVMEKGLVHIYKDMDKYLSAEEALLAEVWDAFVKSLTDKYAHMTDLIVQCYGKKGMPLTMDEFRALTAQTPDRAKQKKAT
eukprot:m51a1_g7608 hypothetical protein (879) ;mRNA; r:257747-261163